MLAIVAALLISAMLLISLKADPIAAFQAIFDGAFGSQNSTAETLVKAIPILFVAIGITVAFRGGVINIGGEGQMIVGALGAAVEKDAKEQLEKSLENFSGLVR